MSTGSESDSRVGAGLEVEVDGGVDVSALSGEVIAAASMEMPFGKFKGTRLIDLPEPYVVWFKGQGLPSGILGQRLGLMYEIKVNGLEKLIRPLLD